MIDLVFNDGVKAALVCAKDKFKANIGNVESLWLELDIGDISALPDLSCRKSIMRSILRGPEDTDDEPSFAALWDSHQTALARVTEAAQTGEPVRIWYSDAPFEACGFHFAASLLAESPGSVTVVKLPLFFEEGNTIRVHDSLASVDAEQLAALLPLEQPMSATLRRTAAHRWHELLRENAPLRATVNGRLISVPAEFYDHVLRRHLPDGEFAAVRAIGNAMAFGELGVRDWWYAQRLRAMINGGELEVVKPNRSFYHTWLKKKER